MVGLMEWASMEVSVEVTCLETDGLRTRRVIVTRDAVDAIGCGTHARYTIRRDRCEGIVDRKRAT